MSLFAVTREAGPGWAAAAREPAKVASNGLLEEREHRSDDA